MRSGVFPGQKNDGVVPDVTAMPGVGLAGREVSADSGTSGKENFLSVVIACTITVFFAALIGIWFAFDNRIPTTDEAGHIMNALDYKQLLSHARPLKADWWQHFLSVNKFYPPAVYVFNGCLKLALGNARWVDVFSVLIFSALLTLSTFSITKVLSRSLLAASVAAIVVNVYPLMANLCRNFLLDFPLTSMISAGLCALILWRSKPDWTRSLIAGCVIAAACMTKQIAAAYLILPGVLCFVEALIDWKKTKSPARVLQVVTIAGCVLLAVLPWAAVNIQWIRGYSAETAANMKNAGFHLSALDICADYLVGLTHSMSYLLLAYLAFAFCGLRTPDHKKLLLVYLSGVGGLLLISSLTWTFPLDRYASGVLITTAIVTGYGVSVWCTRARQQNIPVIATTLLVALSVAQLISFAFCPHPLKVAGLDTLSKTLGVSLREFRGMRVEKITPYPNGLDWGQQWVLSTVQKRDGDSPVFLNILPSDGVFNPHSFELIARESGMKVRPTTSRVWTIVGDSVEFSPEKAMWYHWYLVKTGFQGNQLKDEATKTEYARLTDFVRHGGKFQLIGEKVMPDASIVSLYRQF